MSKVLKRYRTPRKFITKVKFEIAKVAKEASESIASPLVWLKRSASQSELDWIARTEALLKERRLRRD